MTIRFACPTCQAAYTVHEKDAGKKTTCKCGQRVQIPSPRPTRTVLGEVLPPTTEEMIEQTPQLPPVLKPEAKRTNPEILTPIPEPNPRQFEDEPHASSGYLPPLPKSSRIPKAVLFGGITLGGLLAFSVLVYLLFRLLALSDSTSADANTDLLVWAPKNTDVVMALNFKELNSYPEVAQLLNDKFDTSKLFGFKTNTIETCFVTFESMSSTSRDGVAMFRLNQPFNPNTLISANKAKTRKHGKAAYLEMTNKDQGVIYNPTAPVVVTFRQENTFFEMVGAPRNKTQLSSELLDAMNDAQGPLWIAVVGPPAQLDTKDKIPFLIHYPDKKADPHPLRLSASLSTRIRSDRTEFTHLYRYSSNDKAKIAAEQLTAWTKQELLQAANEKESDDLGLYFSRVLYDTIKFNVSGSSVVVTCQLPHKELQRVKRPR